MVLDAAERRKKTVSCGHGERHQREQRRRRKNSVMVSAMGDAIIMASVPLSRTPPSPAAADGVVGDQLDCRPRRAPSPASSANRTFAADHLFRSPPCAGWSARNKPDSSASLRWVDAEERTAEASKLRRGLSCLKTSKFRVLNLYFRG